MAICYGVELRVPPSPAPTPEGRRIAEVFRSLRDSADLTQEEVAHRVGLTLSGYRAYEQGKRRLRLGQVPLFAAAFNVSVEALASRLELSNTSFRDLHAAECADLMAQIEDEPAEVQATILSMFRDLVKIAKRTPDPSRQPPSQ